MTDFIREALSKEPNKNWLDDLHAGAQLLTSGIDEVLHIAKIMRAAGNDRIADRLFMAADELRAASERYKTGTSDAVHDMAVSAERATSNMMAGILAIAARP